MEEQSEAGNVDEISQLDCVRAVCQSEWGEGDEVRVLPCGHQFQTGCVDHWLGKHKECCLLCKTDVRTSWDPVTATWRGVADGGGGRRWEEEEGRIINDTIEGPRDVAVERLSQFSREAGLRTGLKK